jgi:hypothetical protein
MRVVNDKEKKKAFFTSLGSPKARFRGAGRGGVWKTGSDGKTIREKGLLTGLG